MRALVAGWFSFDNGHATAGDLMVKDVACDWLDQARCPYDVAMEPSLGHGVNWRTVEPNAYTHVAFVCGPFQNGRLEAEFLARFGRHRLIGLDLSMLVPLETWNPFDLLVERDSSADAHADFAFLADRPLVPVVGVCLVEEHPEAVVDQANALIARLVAAREVALVPIDTRLDVNGSGLRTPAEIESLIARVDVLVTTRLHGMVLALKNGVPVVAIDAVPGGAKVTRQAQTIGWPQAFHVERTNDQELTDALTWCLSAEGRAAAMASRARALAMLEVMKARFVADLTGSGELERNFARRIASGRFEQELATGPAPSRSASRLLARLVARVRTRVGRVLRLRQKGA